MFGISRGCWWYCEFHLSWNFIASESLVATGFLLLANGKDKCVSHECYQKDVEEDVGGAYFNILLSLITVQSWGMSIICHSLKDLMAPNEY